MGSSPVAAEAHRSRHLDIAPRLRQAREALGLSLRGLARRTGFSASFLSQVELGQASPSLGSLERIVAALGLELSDLLGGVASARHAKAPLVHRRDDTVVRSDWSRATLRLLLSPSAERAVSVILIGIDPGGQSGKTPYARAGGTFTFCTSGCATLVTGQESITLSSGDSIYYDASLAALWRNDSETRAELLVVSLPD
jgi:transcriptional regulator with XRE-family HTH domain